ncbi:hypothetical protein HG536_0C04060 [Torulaspora globosa]|uniref:Telomere replication protein EST3 n=1 Tax=Torulaspora globosa TaxID=48254 RepID=A0A7G3ZFF1_9SACH|nr:uncharacterized protein HG536_0C04060 [Torulaspora globosa]QLL32237.1 hypothetical protein HG536_0C04060 [Torulaspora globosa]
MPKIILPSRSRQKDNVFLQPWLETRLEERQDRTYASLAALQPPVFGFIPKLSEKEMAKPLTSAEILGNPCHFVKITKFYGVDAFNVFASVRDDRYQILVEFTPRCVSEFERRHRSRITCDTVNSLCVIGDCKLFYRERSYVLKYYKLDIASFKTTTNRTLRRVPVLVVNQISRFEMDQVGTLDQYPFIYNVL